MIVKIRTVQPFCVLMLLLICSSSIAQQADSTRNTHRYKNIIRYNISGALLFGLDAFVIVGYERIVGPNQSFSVNFGRVTLPNVTNVDLDSIDIDQNENRSGVNFSFDYRFYLPRENKHTIPHGLYIGPFYSYNHFDGKTHWTHITDQGTSNINTDTKLNIHTIGFEMGYQFVLWERLTLDVLVVGPGFGFYDLHAKINGTVDAETKKHLFRGVKQLVTQKFPGMNAVFSDEEINSNGTLEKNTWGYRYLVHVGFRF